MNDFETFTWYSVCVCVCHISTVKIPSKRHSYSNWTHLCTFKKKKKMSLNMHRGHGGYHTVLSCG